MVRTSVWVGWNGSGVKTSHVLWSVAYFAFSQPLARSTQKSIGWEFTTPFLGSLPVFVPLGRIKSLATWHAVCTFLCFCILVGNGIIGTIPLNFSQSFKKMIDTFVSCYLHLLSTTTSTHETSVRGTNSRHPQGQGLSTKYNITVF